MRLRRFIMSCIITNFTAVTCIHATLRIRTLKVVGNIFRITKTYRVIRFEIWFRIV